MTPAHLSDLFVGPTGERIDSRAAWRAERRWLLSDFASSMYGAPVRLDPAHLTGAFAPVSREPGVGPPDRPPRARPTLLVVAPATLTDVLADADTGWGRAAATARGWDWSAVVPSQVVSDDAAGAAGLPHVQGTPRPGVLSAWASVISLCVSELLRAGARPGGVVVVGQSRLGKAALLAAARDERISAVVTSQSGLAGAAPSRETVAHRKAPRETPLAAWERFPHWFTPGFATYAADPERLALDQHQLLALCAPRALVVANGRSDPWVDPDGQRLALRAASAAWRWWPTRPGPAWCDRPGGHGVTSDDWPLWLDQVSALLPS